MKKKQFKIEMLLLKLIFSYGFFALLDNLFNWSKVDCILEHIRVKHSEVLASRVGGSPLLLGWTSAVKAWLVER